MAAATEPRLGIPDAQFFTDPRRAQDDITDRLLDESFVGLRVDLPRRVDVAQRQRLPLVLAHGVPHRAPPTPPFDERAVLVVTRLPSNQTLVGAAFAVKTRDQDDIEAPPPPDAPEGTTVALLDTDARARLPELPWRPGELVAWVLFRDQASNAARTTLTAGPTDPLADPAVARFLADQDVGYPQPVWPPALPAEPYPRWTRADEDPVAPAGPGIALAVDRTVVIPLVGEARCVLRAAVRVPFRKRYLVREDPGLPEDPLPDVDLARDELSAEDERMLREAAWRVAQRRAMGLVWQDVLDPAAAAVIPLTIVALPADRPDPVVFPLQVPVYASDEAPLDPARPPETLEGHVAVDLLELPFGLRLAGGTSFIYAFTDGLMAGPAQTAVVRERDLRP